MNLDRYTKIELLAYRSRFVPIALKGLIPIQINRSNIFINKVTGDQLISQGLLPKTVQVVVDLFKNKQSDNVGINLGLPSQLVAIAIRDSQAQDTFQKLINLNDLSQNIQNNGLILHTILGDESLYNTYYFTYTNDLINIKTMENIMGLSINFLTTDDSTPFMADIVGEFTYGFQPESTGIIKKPDGGTDWVKTIEMPGWLKGSLVLAVLYQDGKRQVTKDEIRTRGIKLGFIVD